MINHIPLHQASFLAAGIRVLDNGLKQALAQNEQDKTGKTICKRDSVRRYTGRVPDGAHVRVFVARVENLNLSRPKFLDSDFWPPSVSSR